MKKYFQSLLLLAVAVATATVFASCGDDETPTPIPSPDPDDKVTMGKYVFDYPTITLFGPDTESNIEAEYDAYIQGFTRALAAVGVEAKESYKWNDILANKEKVQCVFDSCGNFEREVQLCKSLRASTSDVTLTAVPYSDGVQPIDFGYKTVNLKLVVPEGTTTQLSMDLACAEDKVPALKDYSAQVLAVFQDALKDVFTQECHVRTQYEITRYETYVNYKGNPDDIRATIKRICKGLTFPEPTAEQVAAAKANNISTIVDFSVSAYDPNAEDPKGSRELLYSRFVFAEDYE